MEQGTIKRFDSERGFGFLACDFGGKDLFFHVRDFRAGFGIKPVPQARVQFEIGEDRSGRPMAQNVRPI
jgi:cold shock CspA family protein